MVSESMEGQRRAQFLVSPYKTVHWDYLKDKVYLPKLTTLRQLNVHQKVTDTVSKIFFSAPLNCALYLNNKGTVI
jgi:hypothetical protein